MNAMGQPDGRMDFNNDRAYALWMLRKHAHVLARYNVEEAYTDLLSACDALLSEFRAQYQLSSTRYWYITPGETFLTTTGTQPRPWAPPEYDVIELERVVWLGKQHLILNFKDERI